MQNEKIIKIIKSEFELHPKAQLIDYYKLFFQGAFGPGHIISNKESARQFLKDELKESSVFEKTDFHDISYINDFYRVNINVINKGLISFDDYLDAFLKSAKLENKINFKYWLISWKYIEQQVLRMDIPFNNIKEQSAELWNIIKNKNLVSHSEIYRKTYSPHYRLINAIQFRRINC